ncbi:MAG: hypothetical protein AAF242_13500, partial [Bacteroidota bacterium]
MLRNYSLYIIVFLLSLPTLSIGQRTENYTVIARPSHLIRTEPNQDAPAISGANSSVVYGGTIKVSLDRVKGDTLEGIAGYWREVTNAQGKKGYMFDGYLMKKGRSALAADQLPLLRGSARGARRGYPRGTESPSEGWRSHRPVHREPHEPRHGPVPAHG